MNGKRNGGRLLLDAAMVAVLALLYRKQAISLAFHEVAGLALLGVFAIHILLNGKWVRGAAARLFSRGTPARARLLCLIDALLLVCFVLIGVSGVLISKVVFSFGAGGAWKSIHYFCAALSLILMGVHLGLHSAWIGGMLKKLLPLPQKAARVLAVLLTVVLCGYGVWSFSTSGFGGWITAPFSAAQAGEGMGAGGGQGQAGGSAGGHGFGAGDGAEDAQSASQGALPDSLPQDAAARETLPEGAAHSGDGLRGEGGGQGGVRSAIGTFAGFFSMMYLVATATALLDGAVRRRKKQLPAPAEGPAPSSAQPPDAGGGTR